MNMHIAKLNKDGRITMPKEMRSEFKLKPGDIAKFEIVDGGVWMTFPAKDITELKGLFPERCKEPRTLEDMEDAISEGANETMKGD